MAPSKKVLFFIPPGVHLLDLSGPVQAFLEAEDAGGGYNIEYCSLSNEEIDSSGLHFNHLPHYSETRLSEGDYLFIPGFNSKLLPAMESDKKWEPFYIWLNQQTQQGIRICSVCIGAFILGKAGLLDGRKCTTHWRLANQLKKSCPLARVQDDTLFVRDGDIYTSAGISSGIDLALYILEEEKGALFTHRIAREMVIYTRRSGGHTQDSIYLDYRNHLHLSIHQLQDWLIDHLHTKTTIEQMAEMVNMSARNLTRTFKIQTGISIHQYITKLRLEKAGTLRSSPGITVSKIASECGFENERQLQRIWKQHHSQ